MKNVFGVNVWAIPLASLKIMSLSKKKIVATDSNPDPEKYKKYKIRSNQFGQIAFKYYTVAIQNGEEEFCILIPEHEGERLTALTGLYPQTEEDGAI